MTGSNPTWGKKKKKTKYSSLAPRHVWTQRSHGSRLLLVLFVLKQQKHKKHLQSIDNRKYRTLHRGEWWVSWEKNKRKKGWRKKKKKQKCLLSVFFVLGLLRMLWVGRCTADPWVLQGFKPVSGYVLASNALEAPKQCSARRDSLFWVRLEHSRAKPTGSRPSGLKRISNLQHITVRLKKKDSF